MIRKGIFLQDPPEQRELFQGPVQNIGKDKGYEHHSQDAQKPGASQGKGIEVEVLIQQPDEHHVDQIDPERMPVDVGERSLEPGEPLGAGLASISDGHPRRSSTFRLFL